MSTVDISIRFFLAIATVLAACRVSGALLARVGQVQVVGEMIAGIALGPSLLGWLMPGVSAYLFPPETKPVLFSLCQVGIVLYMFLIGLEFDLELIRRRARSAALVSSFGILVPFVMGGAVAWFAARDRTLFSEGVSRWEAVLFLGASMSITAFPMLARMVHEQGLTRTSLGTLALAAGSIDDAAAWCILAVALSSFADSPAIALWAIGGGVAYTLLTLTIGRRLLLPLGRRVERDGKLGGGPLSLILMLVMLGAWFTDYIQIYAVFGAFVMGVAMPRGLLQEQVTQALTPITTYLLVPLFFVYSGLHTEIGLLNTPYLWGMAALCIMVASVGKGLACYGAARLSGESPREAMAIGALMNTRGMMELIILNIGLEKGIIQPPLFTMMVLMALVTTLATSPIFKRVYLSKSRIGVAIRELNPVIG